VSRLKTIDATVTIKGAGMAMIQKNPSSGQSIDQGSPRLAVAVTVAFFPSGDDGVTLCSE
jgi:hypothetical protein